MGTVKLPNILLALLYPRNQSLFFFGQTGYRKFTNCNVRLQCLQVPVNSYYNNARLSSSNPRLIILTGNILPLKQKLSVQSVITRAKIIFCSKYICLVPFWIPFMTNTVSLCMSIFPNKLFKY